MASVPDEKTREAIFNVHTKAMPLKDVDIKILASKTEGYVGADIEGVCREAAMLALRKDIKAKEISMDFFDEALGKVKASASKDIQQLYQSLESKFKQATATELKREAPSYVG